MVLRNIVKIFDLERQEFIRYLTSGEPPVKVHTPLTIGKIIKIKLLYHKMLHAQICLVINNQEEYGCCDCCKDLNNLLSHVSVCKDCYNCSEYFCFFIKHLLCHYKYCDRINCFFCKPCEYGKEMFNLFIDGFC